jgi:ferredoxin-NADP reductase
MATEAVMAAQMASQTSKLLRREEVAEGTIAFHFERPSGFKFKAGQFADVTLIEPPETDAEGNTRTFFIASPPFENELVFTTRMRDTAFKHSLKKVPLATEVKISSAAGSFTLHKNRAKPAVFLAGGIGITPFLSIARQAHHDRLPHQMHLFYSNRRPEDAPFLDTLQNLEKTNPNFHLICTMTEMSKSKKEWNGEAVPIDREMLSRNLATLQGPIYYSAGPPAMVAGMKEMLVSAGVDEDERKILRDTEACSLPERRSHPGRTRERVSRRCTAC